MDTFSITVVGNDSLPTMCKIFGKLGLTAVNSPDVAKLGNLKTFTFYFPIKEERVVSARVEVCKLAKQAQLVPMYVFGDSTKVVILNKI